MIIYRAVVRLLKRGGGLVSIVGLKKEGVVGASSTSNTVFHVFAIRQYFEVTDIYHLSFYKEK